VRLAWLVDDDDEAAVATLDVSAAQLAGLAR
jgi:hypothetical protein